MSKIFMENIPSKQILIYSLQTWCYYFLMAFKLKGTLFIKISRGYSSKSETTSQKNNGNYICFLQESYNKNTNNYIKKHLQDLNNKAKRLQGEKE